MLNPMYLDLEIYPNYFLAMFMNEGEQVGYVDMLDDAPLDIAKLKRLLAIPDAEYYSFNGENFDLLLLRLALAGASNATLKQCCDRIIKENLKRWQFDNAYEAQPLKLNHVDLIEVLPGMVSLKIYGGRLHCQRMQDLPLTPDAIITADQVPDIIRYCKNDLLTTKAARHSVAKQIELRRTIREHLCDDLNKSGMGGVYTVDDLRSKSDAQIAESVLKQKIFSSTGSIPRKVTYRQQPFTYVPPDYIQYRSDNLNEALALIRGAEMHVNDNGHVDMPKSIDGLSVVIGNTTYKLGIGGLHSQEQSVSHYGSDTVILKDIDVASYYPSLMLNIGLYPDAMGPAFLAAYREIRDERIAAKRSGDKVKADVLKITLNGAYGKTSSKYSILYNPKMMIYTTMTGQLSMLMLIEALERYGVPIVSANTDGIVAACPVDKLDIQKKIVSVWEKITNLETEETLYKSIHSRDVNNYIAVKTDGSVKTKGFFAHSGLAKSPQNEICADAVVQMLLTGAKIEDSVAACQDIRKFVTVRSVTGGAVKDGYVLGKAVRWYYAKGESGTINYASNGNIVPRSKGARPCMDLPEALPTDLDHHWYVDEANELLMDLGLVERPVMPKLPRRGTKSWKNLELLGLVESIDDKPVWAVPLHDIPPWAVTGVV